MDSEKKVVPMALCTLLSPQGLYRCSQGNSAGKAHAHVYAFIWYSFPGDLLPERQQFLLCGSGRRGNICAGPNGWARQPLTMVVVLLPFYTVNAHCQI